VAKLNKAIYGLCQSGYLWNQELSNSLKQMNLTQAKSEPSIYYGKNIIIIVYVDDLVIMGTKQQVQLYQEKIHSKYKCEDLGNLSHMLGIKFKRTSTTFSLDQSHYIRELLTQFGMEDSKPVSTPMTTEYCPTIPVDRNEHPHYRQLIGSLLYIFQIAQDQTYHLLSTNYLSKFQTQPMKCSRQLKEYSDT
jgi:hypothetical protein